MIKNFPLFKNGKLLSKSEKKGKEIIFYKSVKKHDPRSVLTVDHSTS